MILAYLVRGMTVSVRGFSGSSSVRTMLECVRALLYVYISVVDWSAALPEHCVTHLGRVLISRDCLSTSTCLQHGWAPVGEACRSDTLLSAVPDVFLLSCILFLGTFSIAYFLKTFRTSAYFPTQVRPPHLTLPSGCMSPSDNIRDLTLRPPGWPIAHPR